MHWWTWVVMGVVVLAALVVLAVVGLGTMRRLEPLRKAQEALQGKLETAGEALSARVEEKIAGPLELLELRAGRTGEQIAILKSRRRAANG